MKKTLIAMLPNGIIEIKQKRKKTNLKKKEKNPRQKSGDIAIYMGQ